ncbi:MAG: hypothetical protein AVDCRST_MAG35-2319, partial [uncultured Quadrisphaera sp.]
DWAGGGELRRARGYLAALVDRGGRGGGVHRSRGSPARPRPAVVRLAGAGCRARHRRHRLSLRPPGVDRARGRLGPGRDALRRTGTGTAVADRRRAPPDRLLGRRRRRTRAGRRGDAAPRAHRPAAEVHRRAHGPGADPGPLAAVRGAGGAPHRNSGRHPRRGPAITGDTGVV